MTRVGRTRWWAAGMLAALLVSAAPRLGWAGDVVFQPQRLTRMAHNEPGGLVDTPPALRQFNQTEPTPTTPEAGSAATATEKPVFKRWWFWALTAAVVGGTVALGAWAVEPTTPPAKGCTAGTALCFGEGRPR